MSKYNEAYKAESEGLDFLLSLPFFCLFSLFGKEIYKETLLKVYKWEIKNPEPYILLSTMIGQTPEMMFGECLASVHKERERKR